MNRLIDAFEGLLAAAARSGGDLATTANFALESVNWKDRLSEPKATTHPVVESHLERLAPVQDRAGRPPTSLLKPCCP